MNKLLRVLPGRSVVLLYGLEIHHRDRVAKLRTNVRWTDTIPIVLSWRTVPAVPGAVWNTAAPIQEEIQQAIAETRRRRFGSLDLACPESLRSLWRVEKSLGTR